MSNKFYSISFSEETWNHVANRMLLSKDSFLISFAKELLEKIRLEKDTEDKKEEKHEQS